MASLLGAVRPQVCNHRQAERLFPLPMHSAKTQPGRMPMGRFNLCAPTTRTVVLLLGGLSLALGACSNGEPTVAGSGGRRSETGGNSGGSGGNTTGKGGNGGSSPMGGSSAAGGSAGRGGASQSGGASAAGGCGGGRRDGGLGRHVWFRWFGRFGWCNQFGRDPIHGWKPTGCQPGSSP